MKCSVRLLILLTYFSLSFPLYCQNVVNGHEYVDLGLPSGTLWATCNLGANSAEEKGDYFAWGETTPQNNNTYSWESYKWCNGSSTKLTKYVTDSSYGMTDHKKELDTSDDAACANWGRPWCIPSEMQIQELLNSSYTILQSSSKGLKITSIINGNSIFLPAAGCRGYGNLNLLNNGRYWSRTLHSKDSRAACILEFTINGTYDTSYYFRFCGSSVRPVTKQINIRSIVLSQKELTIPLGSMESLQATVSPDSATNRTLMWKSCDTTIVSVTQDGVVHGIDQGETLIIVKSLDGTDISDTCKIKVMVPIKSFSFEKEEYSINVGESIDLGLLIEPQNADNKIFNWSSSNTSIASIESGKVTAKKLGETTITATTTDGSNLTASCRVNVIPTMVESISLSKSEVHLILGNSERISATILPTNATNKAINWEVENPNIASVNDGLITALGIGNTTVKAIATDGSEVFAICSVIVNPISISSIELSPSYAAINVGEGLTLSATISPSNASNQHLLWQSSDNDVASVANGVVIGKRPGNVIITAQSTDGSNKSAMASIKVNDILASNIYLDQSSISMFVGDEDVLVATITPMNVTNNGIIWSTTNSAVATVKDGHVIAKGFGCATITATTADGTDLSAMCQISVDKRSQSISWSQTFYNVVYGGQLIELSAKSSSDLKIKYKSNDESIVSIFDLGDVVYLNPGNCGKTSIIAYQEGNYEYYPSAEYQKEVEVVNSSTSSTKALVAYYSQSSLIDGIVAELAKQIVNISGSVYTAEVEPVNDRINDAATNYIVRDSVMSIISSNPNDVASYPDIKPMSFDINDYDIVIMVYPLWNDAMAAPMQTFRMIYQHSYKNKEVGYIEYDEVNNHGTSSTSNVLRMCSNDIENANELINEWLNNNDPTGIKLMRSKGKIKDRGVYDIQGCKLQNVPQKGLYIENGKKVTK